MVNNYSSQIDLIFHSLSDPTRRAILIELSKAALTVSELARPHEQSLAGISKHLKVLEEAELIKKNKQGRVITCEANLAPLKQVEEVLEELGAYWRGRLDSLENFLNNTEEKRNEQHKQSQGHRKKGSKRR